MAYQGIIEKRTQKSRLIVMLRIFLSVLSLAVTISLSGVAHAKSASDIRLFGDENRTRLVVDIDHDVDFGLLRLADPYRIVIDLPDVSFDESIERGQPRGLISDYRFGLIAEGKARIVLDLEDPVEVARAFFLPESDTQPGRLVVDIVPSDRAAFLADVAEDEKRVRKIIEAKNSQKPAVPTNKPVVMIDAGHGGIDSGAIGDSGIMEKTITLEFAKALYDRLSKKDVIHPVMTRDGDTFLPLGARVEAARRAGASLLVSIHADSVRQNYVRGATVYTLSEGASDQLAAALAERENRSDVLAGIVLDDQSDVVADILFDLARRESRNLSVRFARDLVDDMRPSIRLNKSPWRRAAFSVLRAPDVPSVLLELGYLSNRTDEKLMRSDDWQEESADLVATSIEAFVAQTSPVGN